MSGKKIIDGLKDALAGNFAPAHPAPRDDLIIRRDPSGGIDEVIARDCCIHIEQLAKNEWHVDILEANGRQAQFWIGAKNRNVAVDCKLTDRDDPPPPSAGECVVPSPLAASLRATHSEDSRSPQSRRGGPAPDKYKDALEKIALLDFADGHELTERHAFEAVAIATSALGKHPSEIDWHRHYGTPPAQTSPLKETPQVQPPSPEVGGAVGCVHETLQFGSGDYYILCHACNGMWMRGSWKKSEYGKDAAGRDIGAAPDEANKGRASQLSGHERVVNPSPDLTQALAALEPFAKYAERIDNNSASCKVADACPIFVEFGAITQRPEHVTVANLRRAASVYADLRRARAADLSAAGVSGDHEAVFLERLAEKVADLRRTKGPLGFNRDAGVTLAAFIDRHWVEIEHALQSKFSPDHLAARKGTING